MVQQQKLVLRKSGLTLVAGLNRISNESVLFIRETFLSVVEIFADYVSFCHGQLDDKAVHDLKIERRGLRDEQDLVIENSKQLTQRLRQHLENASIPQQGVMAADQKSLKNSNSEGNAKKQGYLFRKPESRIARHWPRRWFVVEGSSFYYTRPEEHDSSPKIVVPDVTLVSVKEVRDGDRRYCFEIVPIQGPSHIFQAEHEEDMRSWIQALQKAASIQMEKRTSLGGEKKQNGKHNDPEISPQMKEIQEVPGNRQCVDCYCDNPTWYSQNLGCLMCIECSGVHRGLSVDVSRVRSLQLDQLPTEMVVLLKATGNNFLNELLEDVCPVVTYTRHENWDRQQRAEFVFKKYIKKEFVTSFDHFTSKYHYWTLNAAPEDETKINKQILYLSEENTKTRPSCNELKPIVTLTPNLLLAKASEAGNLRLALAALCCWGADPNCELVEENQMTPLMLAARNDRTLCAQLLLAHGAKVDQKDSKGQTPLVYASLGNSTAVGCLVLLKEINQRLFIEHLV